MAHIGSANSDEAAFSRGGTLDFTRSQARNLYCGLGPALLHRAPLAKLMIRSPSPSFWTGSPACCATRAWPLNRRDGLSRPYRELGITLQAR